MQNKQVECNLVDVKDKIVVLFGDEWDSTNIESLKEMLKRKGAGMLGMMIMPDIKHQIVAASKEEVIRDLKTVIAQLEAM